MNYLTPHKFNQWYSGITNILIIIFGIFLNSGAQSLQYGNIHIEEGGNLWIEGSAGVVDYKCQAQKLSGVGSIQNTENPSQNVQEEGDVQIEVAIPVKTLDCGKKAMNKDMYNALKAESQPMIQYRLLSAGIAGDNNISQNEWMDIRLRGIMKIAGVSDTTEFEIQGLLLDKNRFRVKGSKQIHMDSYNIKPPTALLGLIRADKDLVVNFDVTVLLED